MYPSPLAPPAPTLHATNLQPSSGSGNVSASNRPGTPSAGGASSVRVEISSSYRSDPPVGEGVWGAEGS